MIEPKDKRSTPRKLIDASFVWQKEDGYYAAIDLMTRVNSMVLFSLSYNLYDVNFPNISKRRIKRYLKLRKLPDVEGVELVNENNSCYSNVESVVFVRSLGKHTWKKGNYNAVTINNLAMESDSYERKFKSIKNIKVTCRCLRNSLERSCRPASFQKKIFRDERRRTHIPSSFIDTVFCKHACVGLDWLATFNSAANFDFFGIYAKRTIEVSNQVVDYILTYNLRLPDYRINELLNERKVEYWRTYRRYWTEPLRKFIFY